MNRIQTRERQLLDLSKSKSARGFTLIELLIVITIILILVGIAANRYDKAVLRAKETTLHADLMEMRKAIDNYTMDKQAAPQSLDDLVPQYLHAIPVDQITNAKDWVPQMDNVVLTPHLGYVERDSLEGMFNLIFDQILAYERGQPINVANPEVLATAQLRR